MTWGHGCGGSPYAWSLGLVVPWVAVRLNGDRLRSKQRKYCIRNQRNGQKGCRSYMCSAYNFFIHRPSSHSARTPPAYDLFVKKVSWQIHDDGRVNVRLGSEIKDRICVLLDVP
jgi:hypothetical protein